MKKKIQLTDFQKNVATIIGIGGFGVALYYLLKKDDPPPPPLVTRPQGEGENLIYFLYDYFSDFFKWGIATDDGAYIKPYVDQIMTLSPTELNKAVNYYVTYYSDVTGEPTLSEWIDDQYYSAYIFADPFESTIVYLENKGL